MGVLFSILAGFFISLQGVFNTRVSDKIGLWEAAAVVHAAGLLFALLILPYVGDGSLKKIGEVSKLYLLGGVFGVIIVFSVMKGISLLGSTLSISILLVTQLIIATAIDTLGLFGNQQIKFDFTKPLGVAVMIIGIIIFKFRG